MRGSSKHVGVSPKKTASPDVIRRPVALAK